MFKVEYISGNRAWCFCPYHNDVKRPNVSITLTKDYYGRWFCWACGEKGNLTEKQMEELNLSKKEKRIKPISIDWGELSALYSRVKPAEHIVALSKKWNVENKSLFDFGVGCIADSYTFPMYNAQKEVIGIHRRYPCGGKRCIEGSELGLFIPLPINDNIIFITEGISDAVVVYNLGFDVIGKPCATYGDKIIRHFLLESDIHSVIIIPDNDEAGLKSAVNTIKALKRIVSCNMFEFKGAKDIREYISKKGKEQVRRELDCYI